MGESSMTPSEWHNSETDDIIEMLNEESNCQ
jgi:hypothetical protein